MDDQMYITIAKVLGGEASPAEHRAVEEWLAVDPGNAGIYADLQAAWAEADTLLAAPEFSTAAAWDKVSMRIRPAVEQPAPAVAPARTGRTMAFPAWIRYSVGVAAILLIAVLLIRPSGPEMVRIAAAAGQNQQVTLPDGSVVTLREGSALSYPEKFASSTRNVALEGEAFFEVARNERQPFIINAQSVDVKVLGTSFNVRCNALSADVAVATGKVQVTAHEGTATPAILIPGQAAHYADQRMVSGPAAGFEAFWKEDTLDFRGVPFERVVTTLGSLKKIPITLQGLTPAALNQIITIRFRRGQSMEAMLNELCLISQTRWDRSGSGYIIRNK